jgi:hypothetical protein
MQLRMTKADLKKKEMGIMLCHRSNYYYYYYFASMWGGV